MLLVDLAKVGEGGLGGEKKYAGPLFPAKKEKGNKIRNQAI